MQFITFISAAAAMAATASAATAKITNRCSYDVHLWSVVKGTGCPTGGMTTLKTGETYDEEIQKSIDATGVSIKISKKEQCGGSDIVQLEYFLNNATGYEGNYLDVSYVDCLGGNCPTKKEGYYLQAGSQTGAQVASVDNTHCPILSCDGPESCAQCSYINPDDTQTKFCDTSASLDFYLCGGEGPDGSGSTPVSEPDSSSAPASSAAASSDQADYAAPSPTSVGASTDNVYQVKAAAVTPVAEVTKVDQKTKTHVEIVYATVTAYEYANSKRHAHGHARRHQQFHA